MMVRILVLRVGWTKAFSSSCPCCLSPLLFVSCLFSVFPQFCDLLSARLLHLPPLLLSFSCRFLPYIFAFFVVFYALFSSPFCLFFL
ncbi:hypothetical protein NC653_026756 [Populus alba x Populus x berolinensis]|uniref:Uncharacterized protein n=1 Tax=Populus alba x Populus x berolinensis TaxID=444605 RepID=A0AAD6M4T5_9ROSI|nr:hypothetical protein NC653_026756 [Populus alba x Populus x berolinensis]